MKTIQDLMIKNPLTISDAATVQDAIDLFTEHRVGCLPVVDAHGVLVAFLSDGDVIKFLARRVKQQNVLPVIYHATNYNEQELQRDDELIDELRKLSVLHCATKRVKVAYTDDNLAEISAVLDNRRLKHMPVLEADTNKLVGLLSRRDIALAFFDSVSSK